MIRSALMNVMTAAAIKAGRSLKRDFGEVENLQVSVKGPGDFVTAADRRAEKVVFEELSRARPGYSFLMEEGGAVEGNDKTHTWHIDPLDGTSNFLHGIPIFAVSIGLRAGRASSSPASSIIRRPTICSSPRRARAPISDNRRMPSRLAQIADQFARGLRHPSPRRARPSPPLQDRARRRHGQDRQCSSARRAPRSTSPSSPPAAATAIGSAASSPGTLQPKSCWCGRPAALSPI